jgi:di/tricarboxylate transporter
MYFSNWYILIIIIARFKKHYDVVIVAVRKRNGSDEQGTFNRIHINVGDTLLVYGRSSFIDKWSNNKDFFVISRINKNILDRVQSAKTITIPFIKKTYRLWWWGYLIYPIFTVTIICAVFGIPMLKCVFVAVCVAILLGLISPADAVKSVDWQLVILIACSFAVGRAVLKSGLADSFASLLLQTSLPTILLPCIMLGMVQLITGLITNNAAVTLFFPLAMSLANTYGVSPRPFAVAVTIGASSNFFTSIGYQTNLMVQGPGGYSALNFFVVGLPLTFIFWIICSILIPVFWPL